MKTLASTLAALAFAAGPATAQTFLDDPVEAEVLQGWVQADGTRVAAMRLTLDDGWKTYWRAPGDAGIPPQFDWSAAHNLGAVQITWPTPSVYIENGMRSLGYKNEVVIPLHITPKRPSRPVALKAQLHMGVCAEVCVPYTLDVDAMLDAPGTKPTPAIVAALAAAPYASDEAGVTQATCRIAPTERGMQIEAHVTLPHTGGREVAVIEPGTPGVWVSEPKAARRGETFVAISEMVHPNGGAFSVNRSAVRITILGANYAVDVQGCAAG